MVRQLSFSLFLNGDLWHWAKVYLNDRFTIIPLTWLKAQQVGQRRVKFDPVFLLTGYINPLRNLAV